MKLKLTTEQKIKANRKTRRDSDLFFNVNDITKTKIFKNKKAYDRKENKKHTFI